MPSPRSDAAPTLGTTRGISLGQAALAWLAGWVSGSVLFSVVLSGSGAKTIAEAGPWWLAAAQLAGWVPMVMAIVLVAQRCATGSLVRDFGFTARPLDLLGLPLGVVTQLVLVRGLYVPLHSLWPHVFSNRKVEQPARDLWNHAHGSGLVVLVIVVAIGAPLVEELTYRGLLQRAVTRHAGTITGVVAVALWFAVIHLQPVNIPGLILVGLVLGICAQRTGRLGMSVLTHMAFNATGLIMVAHS